METLTGQKLREVRKALAAIKAKKLSTGRTVFEAWIRYNNSRVGDVLQTLDEFLATLDIEGPKVQEIVIKATVKTKSRYDDVMKNRPEVYAADVILDDMLDVTGPAKTDSADPDAFLAEEERTAP